MKPEITESEWRRAVEDFYLPKIPEGYLSVFEVHKQIGKSLSRTASILRQMCNEGKADRVRVVSSKGVAYYYKPISEPENK
jgi:hypothetical protein